MAFGGNGATVNFGDPAGDGEAETSARSFAGARSIRASEALKDAVEVVGRDADAGVTDSDVGLAGVVREFDGAAPTGRSVFDSVVDEDEEKAVDGDGISVDPNRSGRELRGELQGLFGGKSQSAVLGAADAGCQIESLHVEGDDAGIGARERKQVFEKFGCFDGGFENAGERFAIFGVGAGTAQGDFGSGADDRDGRAKVVGSVGGELRDSAERVLNAVEHDVESFGELTKLVVSFGKFEATAEILRANGLGGGHDVGNGSEGAGAEPVTEQRSEQN